MEFQDILDTVEAAARRAGELLVRKLESGFDIERKGRIDLVTDADLASQELLSRELGRAFPGFGMLGEEGLDHNPDAPVRWIIDPLDGTTNYAHLHPCFAVSIALEARGRTELGVALDPVRGEMFTALRGGGARLNGAPVSVSRVADLESSLLATGFAYDIKTNPDNNLAEFKAMMMRTQGVRRLGSAALDLCYVACGRIDAFWELRLNAWDTAAGELIVREAGGRTSGRGGEPYAPGGEFLLASNGRLHEQALEVLNQARSRA